MTAATAGVFVTGTDTGCGKTLVSTLLIHALRRHGVRVAGFKPVAAGADWCDGILQNDDALALNAASGLGLPYPDVNPCCYEAPVSPHLAALEQRAPISLDDVRGAFGRLGSAAAFVVAEGAGGWRVPLGPDLDTQDLARDLNLPVVLVVGLRLGCLNHARLTADAVARSGLPLIGWIGSRLDPEMSRVEGNLATLRACLPAPCLGVVPHLADGEDPAHVAARLDVGPMLGLLSSRPG